jgi:DNA primase
LNLARKPIRVEDQVVIVEGYFDVILLHQAVFTNTVSPMGTALNEDQLRLLKNSPGASFWLWTRRGWRKSDFARPGSGTQGA